MAKQIGYFLHKIASKISKNPDEVMVAFFRKKGVTVGANCHIYSNIVTVEPYLIKIGDNVTISSNVTFVTHDNSINKVDRSLPNLYGEIVIGNNCFVGQNATVLYGVELKDDIIVAAGSVVANSFNDKRIIIGGNPAKIIGTWDSFYEKYKECGLGKRNAKQNLNDHPEKLVKRKTKNK